MVEWVIIKNVKGTANGSPFNIEGWESTNQIEDLTCGFIITMGARVVKSKKAKILYFVLYNNEKIK